jgi:hypothetical protein
MNKNKIDTDRWTSCFIEANWLQHTGKLRLGGAEEDPNSAERLLRMWAVEGC